MHILECSKNSGKNIKRIHKNSWKCWSTGILEYWNSANTGIVRIHKTHGNKSLNNDTKLNNTPIMQIIVHIEYKRV